MPRTRTKKDNSVLFHLNQNSPNHFSIYCKEDNYVQFCGKDRTVLHVAANRTWSDGSTETNKYNQFVIALQDEKSLYAVTYEFKIKPDMSNKTRATQIYTEFPTAIAALCNLKALKEEERLARKKLKETGKLNHLKDLMAAMRLYKIQFDLVEKSDRMRQIITDEALALEKIYIDSLKDLLHTKNNIIQGLEPSRRLTEFKKTIEYIRGEQQTVTITSPEITAELEKLEHEQRQLLEQATDEQTELFKQQRLQVIQARSDFLSWLKNLIPVVTFSKKGSQIRIRSDFFDTINFSLPREISELHLLAEKKEEISQKLELHSIREQRIKAMTFKWLLENGYQYPQIDIKNHCVELHLTDPLGLYEQLLLSDIITVVDLYHVISRWVSPTTYLGRGLITAISEDDDSTKLTAVATPPDHSLADGYEHLRQGGYFLAYPKRTPQLSTQWTSILRGIDVPELLITKHQEITL